jgi:hypothetical protein
MIDQTIFEDLQTKIDEESTVRDVSLTSASLSWMNPSRAKPFPSPTRKTDS